MSEPMNPTDPLLDPELRQETAENHRVVGRLLEQLRRDPRLIEWQPAVGQLISLIEEGNANLVRLCWLEQQMGQLRNRYESIRREAIGRDMSSMEWLRLHRRLSHQLLGLVECEKAEAVILLRQSELAGQFFQIGAEMMRGPLRAEYEWMAQLVHAFATPEHQAELERIIPRLSQGTR